MVVDDLTATLLRPTVGMFAVVKTDDIVVAGVVFHYKVLLPLKNL